MNESQTIVIDGKSGITKKILSFVELLKLRLSFLVVFSSAFGYILGYNGTLDWTSFILFSIGGFMVSGSAVTLNQIFEKDLDVLMKRTRNRPLPTDRINSKEALIYSVILIFVGLIILLYSTNLYAMLLSLVSLIIYAFIYTPLKRVGPIAVLVGAIPGALPPLIGWVLAFSSYGNFHISGRSPGSLMKITKKQDLSFFQEMELKI